jgi:peptidoglycan/xylan/chitin deacetylase (PgdA/CDA1 family)
MTRKQERRRRFVMWAGTMGAGALLALAAALLLPAGWLIAVLILGSAAFLGHRHMIAPPGAVVLTYHSVSPDPAWLPWSREISVHPETFESHLATLAKMGCTVMGTRDLAAARRSGGEPPRDAVALHFDDGYRDNWLHAVPALARHGFPATFFASLDFIEPDDRPHRDGDESGYMSWAELRAIEANPLFEVEPHGVDHARVPVSDRIVDRVNADNWRSLAWLQWAATPGPKHDWFRAAIPVAVPLGAPVPESGLALAARQWRNGRLEDQATFERRIESDLALCNARFAEHLDRAPQIFCWPENAVGAEGRRIADVLGYTATTGGKGRNTADEPPHILSRIHMGDRAIGVRWQPAEALHLRAAVRLAQGNHYWYLVIAPMNLLRSLVLRARAAIGSIT